MQSVPFQQNGAPILSSDRYSWEHLIVELFQHPAGEATCLCDHEHTLCLSLSPRPVRFLQAKGGKTFSGVYSKGDLCLTPARMSLFARWESDDHYLQVRLASRFLQAIAQETLDPAADQLELLSEFRTRDPHLEAIALLLLAELQRENQAGQLYISSLANVLAIHLIRQYSAATVSLPTYEGGLPERQLLHVLDYINAHLEQDMKLSDLAQLVGLSQFHFSRLFKRSLGVSPYQYLMQQRIERAKGLLKQTDEPIMEIALRCGFNSHSHLSSQFRQSTGMTPKAYRTHLS